MRTRAVHGLQPKVLRKYIELSKVPGKVLRKYMELIKTEQALGDAIRTYTIYDTPTELDSSAILVHFRSATDTVICMDQWLKKPGFGEPFFKRVAMIMDPAAANTAWRTVPLCHTPKFAGFPVDLSAVQDTFLGLPVRLQKGVCVVHSLNPLRHPRPGARAGAGQGPRPCNTPKNSHGRRTAEDTGASHGTPQGTTETSSSIRAFTTVRRT